MFGIRLLFVLCTLFGRGLARLILKPVMFYYLLTHGVARRASRHYLELVAPRVTHCLIYRHFLSFAEVMLDRVFLLRGKIQHFEATRHQGLEHLRRLREQGKGALLLGAHLGSFEAMRVLAQTRMLPINAIVYSGNARMINDLLGAINPDCAARIIEIEPGTVASLLKIKELVDAGQLVALLGDRVGLNEKVTTVDFFGRPARMPTGPYLLAALLGCPVYLTFGLYTAPNRYEFFCEPFLDEGLALPREGREALLRTYAERFARRLEHYCRQAPLNWFNFYDFWRDPEAPPGVHPIRKDALS